MFPTFRASSSLSEVSVIAESRGGWDETGDDLVELGVVPREVSGDRGAKTGEGERYISVIGGNLNRPVSGFSDGSFRSESSGKRRG